MQPSNALITQHFQSYYQHAFINVSALQQREFGFGWRSKIDARHYAFKSAQELNSFLRSRVPRWCSCSAARYALPAAPMERKRPLGNELIFDLDRVYVGEPKAAPHRHSDLLCRYCLERSRNDALRLIEDFLINDFGLRREEVSVNYSGNKGFHIHVRNEAVEQLDQEARRSLLSYITGDIDVARVMPRKEGIVLGPSCSDAGWGKKIYTTLSEAIARCDATALRSFGISTTVANALAKNKEFVLNLLSRGRWSALPFYRSAKKIIRAIVEQRAIIVDKQVTLDRSRLIRVPNTLHGDTALVAAKVDRLDSFDPLRDAIAFKSGSIVIKPLIDAQFELGDTTHEVRKNAISDLPTAAALLLLCKGLAEVE